MDVLVTCMYEDLIKNEGATVVTTLYGNFSDAQGQITLVLVLVLVLVSVSFMHVLVTRKNEDD